MVGVVVTTSVLYYAFVPSISLAQKTESRLSSVSCAPGSWRRPHGPCVNGQCTDALERRGDGDGVEGPRKVEDSNMELQGIGNNRDGAVREQENRIPEREGTINLINPRGELAMPARPRDENRTYVARFLPV
jgi:hypothetical protein